MKFIYSLLFLFLIYFSSKAQDINYSYGKVSYADFDYKLSEKEAEADAVYLYKSAKIYGDILVYQYRIKVLTEKGLDLANWKITYNWGQSADVNYVFGESHTLENGKIVVKEIDKKELFIEDLGDDYRRKSFTIPNVKVGSIIEIKYKIEKQLNFYLPSFYFQEEYPVVKSKLVYQSPNFVSYAAILSGIHSDDVVKKEGYFNDSDSPGRESLTYIYIAKNLPAFKKEKFVYDHQNYITKMRFQAHSTTRDGVLYNNWDEVTKILKRKLFEITSGQKSLQLLDEYKYILDKNINDIDKIKEIVSALQDDYLISNDLRLRYNTTLVKDVYNEKKGSPSDLNILAGVLFLFEKIPVEPIFLSTLDNGYLDTDYPYLRKFNHFVWKYTDENEKDYIVDVRNKFAPIELIKKDMIGVNGLNFYKGKSSWHSFTKGIRTNKKEFTSDILITEEEISSNITTILSDYAAVDMREKIDDLGLDEVEKMIKEKEKIKELSWSDVEDIHKPLKMSYATNIESIPISDTEIAFKPFQNISMTKNILNEEDRTLPLEFYSLRNTSKKITITIPEGYTVKDIPENLNANYEKSITAKVYYNVSGNKIQILSKIRFKSLFFEANQYEDIKKIFSALINKENELISIIKD